MPPSNEQALKLFEAAAILVIKDLPPGSTFGCDGSAWTTKAFSGLKFIPPGLHLFITGASSSNVDPETLSSAIGVRHGLLRFVAQGEVVVRQWNVEDQSMARHGKRRRLATPSEVTDVISKDSLKSIDSELAPYPFERLQSWAKLSAGIDKSCVSRVIGFTEDGDAPVDAVMAAIGDLDVGRSAEKQQWGKQRAESQPADEIDPEESLHFVDFDLKRSWPEGAVGEEVSRHSRDKSWLLGDVIMRQLGDDELQLLAELSLSFVLFTLVHNFAALEAYRRIFSLICRSTDALSQRAALFETFVSKTFPAQLESLDADSFFTEMPELESFYLTELGALAATIKAARRRQPSEALERVVSAWQKLSLISSDRFGWTLASVEPDREEMVRGKIRYNLLRPEGQSEDEDEDDLPVVVLTDEAPAEQDETRASWRAQVGLDDDDDGPVRFS